MRQAAKRKAGQSEGCRVLQAAWRGRVVHARGRCISSSRNQVSTLRWLEISQETDILDVWFESGSSHAAVLGHEPNLPWPSDVYLEGGDQYRGWFHSSLLCAMGYEGSAPTALLLRTDGRSTSKGERCRSRLAMWWIQLISQKDLAVRSCACGSLRLISAKTSRVPNI